MGRLALLLPAGVALLMGLDAAALLLGLPAPISTERLPQVHGMLMVFGFVGTLIALERAVALRHPAGYAAPALLGLGGLLLLSPAPLALGKATLLLGAAGLAVVYIPLWRRQHDDAVLVQAFGAVLAVGGVTLWVGDVPTAALLPWPVAFMVLTIAGERLELARVAMGPTAGCRLVLLAAGMSVGVLASLLWPTVGYPLLGLATLALTGWLGSHDVAWRTIRSPGPPRFMAGCMLAGYCWLAVAGGVWLLTGAALEGPTYDAVVHAVFLGFTVSMIMAHAPVILPAVLRRPLPYRPVMLVPAVVLHLSLVLRLWVGDSLGVRPAWQAGGLGTIAALLLFVASAVWSAATASEEVAASGPERQGRGGFWPLRDLPVVFWLAAAAISALAHSLLPAPRWLIIHLLLLGAVTHAILVWSRYFADALLHAAPHPGDRARQTWRLAMLNGGVVAVVAGVLGGAWMVTVTGAGAVGAAVAWHGVALVLQMRRALPGHFAVTTRFYVAAACFLPVGATLGVILARGVGGPAHVRLMFAHAVVNLLGWMGLTIVGTLGTLWPTMLGTRIAEGAETAARWTLPVLAGSVLTAAGGAVTNLRYLAVAGLVGYLAGLGLVARSFVDAARRKPPHSYPTWSVLAGMLWLVGCLVALAIGVTTARWWTEADAAFRWLTPLFAAGFGVQVLLGALSHLVPVALSHGPAAVRAANGLLQRGGALRIVAINAGLLVCALPVPGPVRVLASGLVLAGLATFLPLLLLAVRASRRTAESATTDASL